MAPQGWRSAVLAVNCAAQGVLVTYTICECRQQISVPWSCVLQWLCSAHFPESKEARQKSSSSPRAFRQQEVAKHSRFSFQPAQTSVGKLQSLKRFHRNPVTHRTQSTSVLALSGNVSESPGNGPMIVCSVSRCQVVWLRAPHMVFPVSTSLDSGATVWQLGNKKILKKLEHFLLTTGT